MKQFDDLIQIVRTLRAPGGCPWDRAQKLEDYKRFLLEEAYELIEGIDDKNVSCIKEELGDLFLILVVISEMAIGKNKKIVEDVLEGINKKLVSRHPHVFSRETLSTKEEVLAYWVKNKAKKKKRKTVLERLPLSAPALFLAELFFREYLHIRGGSKTKSWQAGLEKIGLLINRVDKNKKAFLADILLELCRLAVLEKIDLEPLLRRKVLRLAAKAEY